jgi:adenylate cyclase
MARLPPTELPGVRARIQHCRDRRVALEIERRFLVVGEAWRNHVRWSRALRQGYLVVSPDGLTLRVRASGLCEPLDRTVEAAEAWLTLKAAPPGEADGAALSRLEFEYGIPLSDAETLLDLCATRLLKRRHGLDLPGGDWVLDVFEAENAPLVVAEVELVSPEAPVAIPPWCVRELTGAHQLSNAALARRPLSLWSPAERQALLGDDR